MVNERHDSGTEVLEQRQTVSGRYAVHERWEPNQQMLFEEALLVVQGVDAPRRRQPPPTKGD